MAVDARENGLLNRKISRRKAIKEIDKFQKQHNLTQTSFPNVYPSQAIYEQFWNASFRRERRLLPYLLKNQYGTTTTAAQIQVEHRMTFERAKASHKFCKINTDATLNDPVWIKFFKTL